MEAFHQRELGDADSRTLAALLNGKGSRTRELELPQWRDLLIEAIRKDLYKTANVGLPPPPRRLLSWSSVAVGFEQSFSLGCHRSIERKDRLQGTVPQSSQLPWIRGNTPPSDVCR